MLSWVYAGATDAGDVLGQAVFYGEGLMADDVMALIRTKYKSLSRSQAQVADYVSANPEKVMLLSLYDLATACGVSEPTVIRFLRKLGYASYQVFRVAVAQNAARDTDKALYSEVASDDACEDVMRKVVSSTKCALDDLEHVLSPEALEKACHMILKARHVFVIGVGASYAIAFDLYHKLLKLGIPAQSCNDPHIINIHCRNLGPEDLLVAVSHSGESREILGGVGGAEAGSCPVCAITSFPSSSLAKKSAVTLISSSLETNYRSDAMTSRIIQLCIIDMLYISLALTGGERMLERIRESRLAVAQNKT